MSLIVGNGNLNNKTYNKPGRAERNGGAAQVKGADGKLGRYTIGDLKPGMEFKASISDVNNNTIKLRLTDGQEISARIDSNGEFNIGEEITFTVKANDGIQIDISPAKIPQETNPTLLRALNAADLPVNDKNLTMVQTMMNEQMSVDKNSLMGVYRKMLANPVANIETIVQMSKFNIEINTGSITQFENYKNFESQISNDLLQLTDSLTSDLNELVSTNIKDLPEIALNNARIEATENQNASLTSQEIVTEDGSAQNGSNTGNSKGFVSIEELPQAVRTEIEQLTEGLSGNEKELVLKQQFTNNYNNLSADLENIKSGNNIESIEYHNSLAEIVLDSFNKSEDSNPQLAEELNVTPDENFAQEANGIKTQNGNENGVTNPISNALSQDELSAIARDLELAGFSKEIVDAIKTGDISSEELLKEIYSKFNNDKGTTLQLLDQNILSNKAYQKLLSKEINKQWFMKPEEVGEEQKVSNLYEKLNKHVKSLESQLQNISRDVPQTTQMLSNISNNIDMMNQINHLYNMVQIPLKMNGQDAQSDLYVFTNKKNLNDPDGEIKALLHLDLDALGSVDAFLKLQGTKLDTKFTLQNDETYDLFEKHIDRLVTRLEAKGYNCEIQFDHGKTEMDFVEDFLKQGQAVGNVARFSFDVRA